MNTAVYKQALEAEVKSLTDGMSIIGHETNDLKGDWVANPTSEQEADFNVVADQAEEIETNDGIIDTLEERLRDVNEALVRIEDGTYGRCKVCDNEIEAQRLDADPAAKTCMMHM